MFILFEVSFFMVLDIIILFIKDFSFSFIFYSALIIFSGCFLFICISVLLFQYIFSYFSISSYTKLKWYIIK